MSSTDAESLKTIRRKIDRALVTLKVNGAEHRVAVRPYDVLLDTLRENLNLTGTRRGCDMGTCGCCTVLLDGRPALSCLVLTLEAEGKEITTIEAVASGEGLHPLQEAWTVTGASQCGFCTPGFIMTALAFVEENPDPTEPEIREAISGNLCRCTGYSSIIEAVARGAAEVARRQKRGDRRPPADPAGKKGA